MHPLCFLNVTFSAAHIPKSLLMVQVLYQVEWSTGIHWHIFRTRCITFSMHRNSLNMHPASHGLMVSCDHSITKGADQVKLPVLYSINWFWYRCLLDKFNVTVKLYLKVNLNLVTNYMRTCTTRRCIHVFCVLKFENIWMRSKWGTVQKDINLIHLNL